MQYNAMREDEDESGEQHVFLVILRALLVSYFKVSGLNMLFYYTVFQCTQVCMYGSVHAGVCVCVCLHAPELCYLECSKSLIFSV